MTTQDKNIERASKLDTATISDALDKLGIVGQCYKIKPRSSDFRTAARAFTIKYGRRRCRSARSVTSSTTYRSAASLYSTTAAARTAPCGATS